MKNDFRDALAELLAADARFLIVGAHALSVHGVPRATVDLDIFVDPARTNAARVWRAFAKFGAPLLAVGVEEEDFARPPVVVQFGQPPDRIDVMCDIDGVTFEEAWSTRVEHAFEDLVVPYIGRDAFVRNKYASGRTKDLADLEYLGEA